MGVGDDVALGVEDNARAEGMVGGDLHDRGQHSLHHAGVSLFQVLRVRRRLGQGSRFTGGRDTTGAPTEDQRGDSYRAGQHVVCAEDAHVDPLDD
jgi:hypothetical protein